MYIPKETVNLKDQKVNKIRLGIQGEPGTGKTTSALTFPNPVVINFDDGLGGHFGKDVIEFPVWSYDWCIKYGCSPTKPQKNPQPDRKSATIKILKGCLYLTEDQTLILDSWTALQTAFDIEQATHPLIQNGEINAFDFWEKKIDFSEDVISLLVSMKCHVVVLFHEVLERDKKTGLLLNKCQPMMQGKFQTKLKLHFPNYFRMLAEGEIDKDGKELGCKYFWQVKADSKFDHKCILDIPDDIFKVEPHFKIFEQYSKKISS